MQDEGDTGVMRLHAMGCGDSCEGIKFTASKHEMGSSVAHVFLDKLPLNSHAFAKIDGKQFHVRSHNYEATGKKIASGGSMADVIGMDLFKTDCKVRHIMRNIEIPDEFLRAANAGNNINESLTPRLFVVNFMIPDYAPSNPVWGQSKTDGKGYSVVFYIKISSEFDNTQCSAAFLLTKFLEMDCEADHDFDLRSRLKGIPVLKNPEILNFGIPLKHLIRKYNGKPFLTGPNYHYYTKSDAYLECDVDVHQWIYPARKAMQTLLPEIVKLEVDFGFVIEGHGEENPERMLCSIRLRHINPENAVHIINLA